MAFDSHLPEGIEPGPQTLRLQAEGAGMRGVLPALTVLFIACFIGIPLGDVSVTDSQGVIYATLGALAVVSGRSDENGVVDAPIWVLP